MHCKPEGQEIKLEQKGITLLFSHSLIIKAKILQQMT